MGTFFLPTGSKRDGVSIFSGSTGDLPINTDIGTKIYP
jgi:hypothetical protein